MGMTKLQNGVSVSVPQVSEITVTRAGNKTYMYLTLGGSGLLGLDQIRAVRTYLCHENAERDALEIMDFARRGEDHSIVVSLVHAYKAQPFPWLIMAIAAISVAVIAFFSWMY